ncbi:MAG: hypothetical protein ABH854_01185 [Candidatus Diapherotrites archaeon]
MKPLSKKEQKKRREYKKRMLREFKKRYDKYFSPAEMKIRKRAEKIRARRSKESEAIRTKQLLEDLKHYGFNPKDWKLDFSQTVFEGHDCSECGTENRSNIFIRNKKNPKEWVEGWCDWAHIKRCREKYSEGDTCYSLWRGGKDFEYYVNDMKKAYEKERYRKIDPGKSIYYWDYLKVPKDLAKKYGIKAKDGFEKPDYIREMEKGCNRTSAHEMEICKQQKRLRERMRRELAKIIAKQLLEDMPNYGFRKNEWKIDVGKITRGSHNCSDCGASDASDIYIVNKKSPNVKIWAACDWAHLKKCRNKRANMPTYHYSRHVDNYIKQRGKYKKADASKFICFWTKIKTPGDLAKKYFVRNLDQPYVVPRHILEKYERIYV